MVADSTALYYNISLSDVNWLAIMVLLGLVVVGPASIWFLDKYGLRVGVSFKNVYFLLAFPLSYLEIYFINAN